MNLNRRSLIGGLFALGLVMLGADVAQAEKKKITPTKTIDGSCEDEALQAKVPVAITSAKEFAELAKSLKLAETPKVDFTKEMVIITTSRGSKVNLIVNLDTDKGNLEVRGFGTRDLRPGFRYVLGIVSKEGVKTVNGNNVFLKLKID